MPELPEVEVTRRYIDPHVVGRTVVSFDAPAPRQIVPSPEALNRITGRRVESTHRRGKLLFISFGATELSIHLRMSGRLRIGAPHELGRHTRLTLNLDDGHCLFFDNARRFGRVYVGPPWTKSVAGVAPDYLDPDFDLDAYVDRLAGTRRRIKSVLLDQSVASGAGNIYVIEALFASGIHPRQPACTLKRAEIARLVEATQQTLSEAIERGGSSIDWVYPGGDMQHQHRAYGRGGEACLECSDTIRHAVVDTRSTMWCPTCQPLRRRKVQPLR